MHGFAIFLLFFLAALVNNPPIGSTSSAPDKRVEKTMIAPLDQRQSITTLQDSRLEDSQ